jgi:hypothetical protein
LDNGSQSYERELPPFAFSLSGQSLALEHPLTLHRLLTSQTSSTMQSLSSVQLNFEKRIQY